MRAMVLRRILIGVGLLFVVSVLTFILVAFIPGSPAQTILGNSATPAQIADLDSTLGLNRPLWVQYLSWLRSAVTGDLGTSVVAPRSVSETLNQGLAVTLPLVIGATVLSAVVGVAVGVFAAVRGGVLARILDLVAMVGMAVPAFWVALLLSSYFGVQLGWFPATGWVPLSTSPLQWFESLVLPVIALAIPGVAGIGKITRESVDDVMGRDFVEALRVDGIPPGRILLGHTLRNAAVPVLAVIGGQFAGVLGATVIVENIFALPGLGRDVVQATIQHDLPTIVGGAVYFCVLVVLMNLLNDVLIASVNPKVRAAA